MYLTRVEILSINMEFQNLNPYLITTQTQLSCFGATLLFLSKTYFQLDLTVLINFIILSC